MQGYLANFRAQPVDSSTRTELGLPDHGLTYKLSWVNQWKGRPTTPLRDGDVIIGIDGNRESTTLGDFTARLFRESSGRTLQLTVIRDGRTENFDVKIP